MVYIKKLVLNGFKSFARKTEIVFDQGVNVILGPNGSGKSNVADALCFVLGRLRIKSIRAAKAKNLLFMGSKYIKPVKEAYVELIFDNSNRTFAIDRDEIVLYRGVRRNGQSIYRINGEVKTRAEIIEMLAQAGIDPHGFNLILQGQIQSIVRMHSEDRRKIIEEVAGISVYESRKEKSLYELEKTEEKLKEISSILRERKAYLNNLDKERAQALRFKELESTLKRLKASILQRKIDEKQKEIDSVIKSIEEKTNLKDKKREKADKIQENIESLQDEIQRINREIQQASGVEQDQLHSIISNLKAELEGLKVRKENHENRRAEIERRIEEMKKTMPEIEREIKELRKESPLVAKKAQELRKKKDELVKIEDERNKLLTSRTELHSLREIIKDKAKQLEKAQADSEYILKKIEEMSRDLRYKDEEECSNVLEKLKKNIEEKEKGLYELAKGELKNEKIISLTESEIKRYEKIKSDVEKLDICPLCQIKITGSHKEHVFSDADKIIKYSRDELDRANLELKDISSKREKLLGEIKHIKKETIDGESELLKHKAIKDRKEQLKENVDYENFLKNEMQKAEEKRKNHEMKINNFSELDEKYHSKMLEIEEISSRTEENIDNTLMFKERDLESMNNVIKRSSHDLEEIKLDIGNISENIENKNRILQSKEKQEKALNERFKKMFELRDSQQREVQEKNLESSEVQGEIRQIEEQINYLKVGKARLDAESEALKMEISEFLGLELIKASLEVLQERLQKTQESLIQIGSINMRALEVYELVKKEYDIVQEKVDTLEKEKIEIMKIIEEIDKKKTKSFMKTFKAINELFSQNFSKLSAKGTAFLEIENQEDIFAGGINIIVKLAKGKYFDVTSLSGGEQTLVALSLLFAIQEFKPYHFYIFDEIDAALDKRNSERLAALLNQYMKSGQYIVITHNDAIIMNSNVLYGVSMHDGVSKVLSLKVQDDSIKKEMNPPITEQDSAKQ